MPRTKKYDAVRDEMLQNTKVKEEYDKLEQEYTEVQENLNEVVQETVEEKEEVEKTEVPGEIITDTPIEEASDLIKDEVPTQEVINEETERVEESGSRIPPELSEPANWKPSAKYEPAEDVGNNEEQEVEIIVDTSNERLTKTYGFGVKFKE